MRTETITKEIFEFDELDDSAKQRAREWWTAGGDHWQSDEWWQSAQNWAEIAPISIESADYDRGHVECTWSADCEIESLSGLRAWKWLQNNGWFDWAEREAPGACTLTGFCGDAPFADPLVQYSKTPLRVPDLKQVFYECAQAWVFEARSDLLSSYEEETIDDNIRLNEYEFNADGTVY